MERPIRNRKASFKIELTGDNDAKQSFNAKVKFVKNKLKYIMNKPVTNSDILNAALDIWIRNNSTIEQQNESQFLNVDAKKTDEKIFSVAESSLKKLISTTSNHSKYCNEELTVSKCIYRGHVVYATLECNSNCNKHNIKWSSSPYLPNKEFLVNHRINHGFACSGMLPSHYMRFTKGSGIGMISQQKRSKFAKSHSEIIQTIYEDSIEEALQEEIGCYEELDGIDIMSDARHGWRKNAKDSSVVAIGEKTHKVLQCQHITKQDDIVSQRHEFKGTQKVYEYFDSKDVSIKVHTHDRNLSINKLVNGKPITQNQNDTWHGTKSAKKAFEAISKGPRYKEGTTWFEELHDKVEPMATHCHWAIKTCEGDPDKLKSSLLNAVDHYKNIHDNCSEDSRCKTDDNYEPSRVVITNPKSEKALRLAIQSCALYKSSSDYVLGRDTSYVESFNNVMNVYTDKRIAFSDKEYNARANLAVLHWNENVDRDYTSISHARDPRAPRRRAGKKVYKKLTFKFRQNIWDTYMKTMFNPPSNARRNRVPRQ